MLWLKLYKFCYLFRQLLWNVNFTYNLCNLYLFIINFIHLLLIIMFLFLEVLLVFILIKIFCCGVSFWHNFMILLKKTFIYIFLISLIFFLLYFIVIFIKHWFSYSQNFLSRIIFLLLLLKILDLIIKTLSHFIKPTLIILILWLYFIFI